MKTIQETISAFIKDTLTVISTTLMSKPKPEEEKVKVQETVLDEENLRRVILDLLAKGDYFGSKYMSSERVSKYIPILATRLVKAKVLEKYGYRATTTNLNLIKQAELNLMIELLNGAKKKVKKVSHNVMTTYNVQDIVERGIAEFPNGVSYRTLEDWARANNIKIKNKGMRNEIYTKINAQKCVA